MHVHCFSFLLMPMTLKVAAVIFSYTTNMRAAVSTVCSSFASRPLYKPRAPFFLWQIIYGHINDHVSQHICQCKLWLYLCSTLTWFCPLEGTRCLRCFRSRRPSHLLYTGQTGNNKHKKVLRLFRFFDKCSNLRNSCTATSCALILYLSVCWCMYSNLPQGNRTR